ncbi:hypothetical protein WUBG_14846 [Wuchereria bancrofti]|uniref:Laminin G domain-containing protein n=1 Tax=Wuchereria bancrofti TaxID=6293 RepID=J9DWT8_WUCBA|nr:hypothetical protein WUBG_14846 [Wuchereria bancrofti]
MEIEPRSTNDQLLAYQASDYNPKRSNYLALAIRRGKFVYLYSSADGNIEIESPDEVIINVPYHLDLKRFGNRAEVRINGTKITNSWQTFNIFARHKFIYWWYTIRNYSKS